MSNLEEKLHDLKMSNLEEKLDDPNLESHRQNAGAIIYHEDQERDNQNPTVVQLHDLMAEVRNMMSGMAQMQRAMWNASGGSSNSSSTASTVEHPSTNITNNHEKKQEDDPPTIMKFGFESTLDQSQISSSSSAVAEDGNPVKKKKTAFEKNIVMLNLRAKLKRTAKQAKARVSQGNQRKKARNLEMASANLRVKTDIIDLAIMQGTNGTKAYKSVGHQEPAFEKRVNGVNEEGETADIKGLSSPPLQRQRSRRLSVGTLNNAVNLAKMNEHLSPNKRRISIYDAAPPPSWCERTVIHPLNPWHTAWDCLVCVVLMLVLWYMPLTLAFDEVADATTGLSLMIDIIFGIDMIKQFRTGYITVEDEFIIMDPRLIATNYLRGWFTFDFVSCLPIDSIVISIMRASVSSTGGGSTSTNDVGVQTALRGTKSLKMLRLVRIAKLVRLMRVSRAFRYIRFAKAIVEDKLKIEIRSSTIKLFRLLTLVILVCQYVYLLFFSSFFLTLYCLTHIRQYSALPAPRTC